MTYGLLGLIVNRQNWTFWFNCFRSFKAERISFRNPVHTELVIILRCSEWVNPRPLNHLLGPSAPDHEPYLSSETKFVSADSLSPAICLLICLIKFSPPLPVLYLASCRCRRKASLRSGHSSRDRGCHSCLCSMGCRRPLLSSSPHTRSTRGRRPSSPCCICRVPSSCWDKSLSWGRHN